MCIVCRIEERNFKTAQRVITLYHQGMTVVQIADASDTLDVLDVAYLIEEYA